MITALFGVGSLVGFGVAGATFVFNASTPLQLGPVPFFAGAAVGLVCGVAFIARVVA